MSRSIQLSLLAMAIMGLNAQAQESSPELERITVTAQKRPEDLQTVPVAVTVLDGKDLVETVSRDIYDIQAYVPAFHAFQSQSATNSSFSIRGIGTSSQNFGFESSVGLYVDGVYRSRQNAVINDLVDIDAVEILRGPQGTLFGKNTPAGAVVFRTKAPTFENGDGFIRLTAGNDNLWQLAGATSINAIDDVLAFRISGFTTQQDGWINDANFGDNKINDRNRSGIRLQALYKPTDAVDVRIIADYAELDEVCCGALTWQDNRQAISVPGRYGTDALLLSPLFNATLFTGDQFYDYTTALSVLPRSAMQDKGLSAEVTWRISPAWQLVSISGYRAFHSLDDIDTDFTDADLLTTINDADQQAFSQELRLQYDSDSFHGVMGAYLFSQNLDLHFAIRTEADFPTFFAASAAELQPLIDGINTVSQLTGGLIAPVDAAAPGGTSFAHQAYQEQDSYAVFAQGNWQLAPQWSLTAGLRYTQEEKSLEGQYTEQGPGIDNLSQDPALWPNPVAAAIALPSIVAALQGGQYPEATDLAAIAPFQQAGWGFFFLNTASVLPRPALSESLSDDQITGTLKLSWQANKDTLVYASAGTGYKSGGINTDRISPVLDPVFNAEKAQAFELGWKQDWPAQRLRMNVAAHHTSIKDFQASTFTGTGFNLQNAGDISVQGLELELMWLPLSGTQVQLNAARTLATFDSFERGTCWTAYPWHTNMDDPGRPAADVPYCSKDGDRVGFEPQNAFTLSVSQVFRLGSIDSTVSADWQYTGDVMLDDSNDPLKHADSFSLLNLRWQFTLPDWDTDITFWGRNVLNEEYPALSAFDVPVQTGKIMAYPGRPASYGVSLQTYF